MLPKKFLALVALCALSLVPIGCSPAHASPPVGEAVSVGQAAAMLNSAGDHVYASAEVSDGTGITTNIAAAGTYVALKSSTLLKEAQTDGSGCITFDADDGAFAISKRCGVGELELTACVNDVIGENAALVQGAWHRTRAGIVDGGVVDVTTLVGPIGAKTEPAAAARGNLGCVRTIVDASLEDTYDFRLNSGTNADDVVVRQAHLSVKKILNK